jgi:hypothetical protein
MATTYAAYSNIMASKQSQSPRDSVSSAASSTQQQKKSRWSRFVDQLKPIDTPQEPIGIFAPSYYPRKETKKSSVSSEVWTGKPSKQIPWSAGV